MYVRVALVTVVGILGITTSLISPADSIVEKAAKDKIVVVPKTDAAMTRAFAMARSTLDDFLRVAAKPDANFDNFAVKIKITDGANAEYFWVTPFSREGSGFSGVINNDPALIGGVHLGETRRFTRSDIVDWSYFDKSKQKTHGNFTACAILTHEPASQAAEFRAVYGLTCDF